MIPLSHLSFVQCEQVKFRPKKKVKIKTSHKIGSSAIAARIKTVLNKLISESQSGFIKERYIGDCNRLVSDLIEKTKGDNIPGLLVY